MGIFAILIAQTVLPLALIAWIAFAPSRSLVGFIAQSLGTAIGLFALAWVGLWLFPPWWTPYALAALLIGTIALSLRRRPPVTRWPIGIGSVTTAIGFGMFGIFAANEWRLAVIGSRIPPGPSVALSWPLGPGRYFVANGGSTTALNFHADALDQSVAAHRHWLGTAYGVDLVALDKMGLRARGVMPSDPRQYRIFGAPVLAPCAGEVIAAIDGHKDQAVPDFDTVNLAGNHVILRCSGADIVLAHFRQGSLQVRRGQRLRTGAPIALVGNSGGSSEPHLHIHAQAPGTSDAPLSGAPIPITFGSRFLVRSDRR